MTNCISMMLRVYDFFESNYHKKVTINLKNNDNNCFQYAVTVAENHEKV